ncbi:multicopper oxidase LPR1-like [Nymphaea colorata]|nr:multicopper oxidase LPR1-like [Nymphaea colorata]
MGFHVKHLLVLFLSALLLAGRGGSSRDSEIQVVLDSSFLQKFVDQLPDMPRIQTYSFKNGVPVSNPLEIGMFKKKWKFHRDWPETLVFAFGTTAEAATVPGPTIEALRGTPSVVTWDNRLPRHHILPWDATIPSALPTRRNTGIPTVVHLHGGIHGPENDGHAMAWFTSRFRETGPTWTNRTYLYPNLQHPGNLWYHDHAMGLTRVNILAGLFGAYVVRDPAVEDALGLPSGPEFDRHLVIFDRSFLKDGSIFMNATGNNPSIHPQWQPEYFGEAIIVNGKAWPYLEVRRRSYRFRIINSSNARFFRLSLTGGLSFVHIGSDSAYLPRPITSSRFLLAPSEIADVVVDFSATDSDVSILTNDAPYPYPTGDQADPKGNGVVMKFVISGEAAEEASKVWQQSPLPARLVASPAAIEREAVATRYVAMYEYESKEGEPTHLYLNGKSFDAPATETPSAGTTEVWNVINLTEDNHPMHVHLGLFVALEQIELVDADKFKKCMQKRNDAVGCRLAEHAVGSRIPVPAYETRWKNVFKMRPGCLTRMLVRFSLLNSDNQPYPFDAAAEPGYAYHCHILDHEDNVMMRPLKIVM